MKRLAVAICLVLAAPARADALESKCVNAGCGYCSMEDASWCHDNEAYRRHICQQHQVGCGSSSSDDSGALGYAIVRLITGGSKGNYVVPKRSKAKRPSVSRTKTPKAPRVKTPKAPKAPKAPSGYDHLVAANRALYRESFVDAEAKFRAAIAAGATEWDVYKGLGWSLWQQKRHGEARAAFEQSYAKNPSDPQVRGLLASAYGREAQDAWQRGEIAAAKALYAKALALEPSDKTIAEGLAAIEKYEKDLAAWTDATSGQVRDAPASTGSASNEAGVPLTPFPQSGQATVAGSTAPPPEKDQTTMSALERAAGQGDVGAKASTEDGASEALRQPFDTAGGVKKTVDALPVVVGKAAGDIPEIPPEKMTKEVTQLVEKQKALVEVKTKQLQELEEIKRLPPTPENQKKQVEKQIEVDKTQAKITFGKFKIENAASSQPENKPNADPKPTVPPSPPVP